MDSRLADEKDEGKWFTSGCVVGGLGGTSEDWEVRWCKHCDKVSGLDNDRCPHCGAER